MEAYRNLDWSKNNPLPERVLYEQYLVDLCDFPDDIFNLHIDEIDPVHEVKSRTIEDASRPVPKLPTDPRTGETVRQLTIDTTKPLRMFNRFPSGSVLNRVEHQLCLATLNKLNMRLPMTDEKDEQNLRIYNGLMQKLAPERDMFEQFVRNHFMTNLLWRVKTISAPLNTLLVDLWRWKANRWLQQLGTTSYPSTSYQLMTAVVAVSYREHEKGVNFEPFDTEQSVIETGEVRRLYPENVLSCGTLLRSHRVLDPFRDEWCAMRDAKRLSNARASVEALLEHQPEISIVLSASSVALLLNEKRNSEEEWTIPFRIAMVAGRKVLILDSKLPPVKLSTPARNAKAHRLLVKSFTAFIHTDHSSTPVVSEDEQKDTPANAASNQPTEHQYKAVRFDEYMQKVDESARRALDKRQHENRFYQLWKLTDEQSDEEQGVLIDFRQDFYQTFRKTRLFMNLSVKLEHQPEFGAEQMTKAELLHEWARQLLRPNSKTLRIRLDPVTHRKISSHYLELRDIEEELLRLYAIRPRHLITSMWGTLRRMQLFPVGSYLLHRDERTVQGWSVYTEVGREREQQFNPNAVVYDLRTRLRAIEYDLPPLEQYDWIPIDKCFITQLHRVGSVLPCSFPHWTPVRRLNTREKLKLKKKPTADDQQNALQQRVKKGKMHAKNIKRRERLKLLQQEKVKKEKLLHTLSQYAPYEGPSRSTTGARGVAKKAGTAAAPSASVGAQTSLKEAAMAQQPVDYNSYQLYAGMPSNNEPKQ
uniref:Putative nmda receptor-regulated protein 2 c-terminus n=1 Tax=Anopheles marajoara TaxID=58244 RepID=A0A2M4BEX0_9DIPT